MSSPAPTSTVPKDPSPSDEPEDEGAAVVAAGAAVVAVAAELLAELLAPSSPSDPQAPAINPSAKTADKIRQPRRLISVSIKEAPSILFTNILNTDMYSRIMSVREFRGKRQCRDCYKNATKKNL
jgi:hypothetical protein